jgi:DNA-binding CsgD family transcriptional regulator
VVRTAWHRAAATVGPDEAVAAALSAAAQQSSLRGGHLSASRISQVAAARTPDADSRAIRYADAAINAHLGGDVKSAAGLLQQAADCVRSVAIEREVIEGLSILLMLDGRPQQAMEISVGCAERIRAEVPKQAARLYALASNMALLAGDAHSAYAQADLSEMLALPLGGSVLAVAQAARARTEVIRGNSAEGSRLLDLALPILEGGTQRGGAFEYAQHAVPLTLCWLERFSDARRLLDRRIEVAHQYGSPAYLPFPLVVESELAFATCRWDDSQLAALRAAELADQTGQQVHVPRALLLAARVDAWRGNGDACRARIEEASDQPGAAMPWASLLAAELLGRLSFVAGDMQQALDLMEPIVAETTRQGCGDPLHTGPLAEVVEALVRLGRRDEASKVADRLLAVAEQTQRTWTLGAAHRCAGLLAESLEQLMAEFDRALEWHAVSPNIFETARTQLCYGEQLRRQKRRAESRVHLRSALTTFESLGATAWTARARTELGLTAERTASRRGGKVLDLTTQERHVAGLVADGGSNRDVASQLFISEKTVEYHLSSVFRKLGVRSRTQLVSVLGSLGR